MSSYSTQSVIPLSSSTHTHMSKDHHNTVNIIRLELRIGNLWEGKEEIKIERKS